MYKELGQRVSVKFITQSAAIAAIYVVLTLVFAPFSFGAVQVRVSEALSILPLFTAAAVPGLFLGCILANWLGGAIALDIIFGSLATLIGAAIGFRLRSNRWLVPVPTVLSNTLIIPLVLHYGYRVEVPLFAIVLYIAGGEILGSYLLGEILATVLMHHSKKLFRQERNGGSKTGNTHG